jgi:ATP-binding cassette subfamily B protein RaxB
MQTEAAECALACLSMVAAYHGHATDLMSLRRRFKISSKGANLRRMAEIADAIGLEARALRATLEYLPVAPTPCILHWDLNHFVVLNRVTARGAEIFDPSRGRYWMPLAEVSAHFTGVVLQLTPGASFEEVAETPGVSLRALTGRITGLAGVTVQILGLALGIEVLSLLVPFQMQWVIDQALLTNDQNMLAVIAVGFVVVFAMSAALGFARAWLVSWFGASLNAQWVTNVFAHLLKLPMDFFEKRHMGDIVSRFYSIQSIQTTLTGSFIEAVLDGAMGLLALVILTLYSASLTLVVGASILLYAGLRWAMYRALWRINEEQLVYSARQQTELMESIRGIQAIKLANKQAERRGRLERATHEAARRTMQSQRVGLAFAVANQALFGTQRVALVAFGAYLAMQGKFSAGMLVAYVAYADQLSTKFSSLVDKLVEFRMLGLHTKRVADIALTSPEAHAAGVYSGPVPKARIEVKDVGFRYAEGEPWVLRGVSLAIEAGESVAIVGPSGYGKSTLAKLMVGLLEPIEGSIEIDGIDIRRYGLARYRDLIGAVMQDDNLFAGSIADNISLFDVDAAMDDIVAAARMAQFHDDIVAMPMAYESLVGDMGAALSGGQKQRLMLARAIYRKPSILVLDEATSHLDAAREASINASIGALDVTRIILAHRQETIASAQRVIDITRLNGSTAVVGVQHSGMAVAHG